MEDVILSVNGDECTLREFVHANTTKENPIDRLELTQILLMMVGQSISFGKVTVQRIK